MCVGLIYNTYPAYFFLLDAPNSCGANEFQCDNGLCILSSFQCDHYNDCGDLSDEPNSCRKSLLYLFISSHFFQFRDPFVLYEMNYCICHIFWIPMYECDLCMYARLVVQYTLHMQMSE